MTGNVIQFRRGACPITMFPDGMGGRGTHRTLPKCGQPLMRGAKFCEKHEADRVRLTLAVRRQR